MQIKEILMTRDKMTEEDALQLIQDAKTQLQEYVANGYFGYAEDICQEYFGLEPDYIDELLF